jgi:hypothetical protein
MTDEQRRALIEELWVLVARCQKEVERWHYEHPAIAAVYRGQHQAYRHALELIYQTMPDAPGRAEAETQPPAKPVEATP